MAEGAAACGADRVELYTEAYASGYEGGRENAVRPYVVAADVRENAVWMSMRATT